MTIKEKFDKVVVDRQVWLDGGFIKGGERPSVTQFLVNTLQELHDEIEKLKNVDNPTLNDDNG